MNMFNAKFMAQFGYVQGSKEEATHFSTFGGSDWTIKRDGNQLYYWCGMSGCWKKTALGLDQVTLIGHKEPEFRCGPPAPVKKQRLMPQYKVDQYKIYDTHREG